MSITSAKQKLQRGKRTKFKTTKGLSPNDDSSSSTDPPNKTAEYLHSDDGSDEN